MDLGVRWDVVVARWSVTKEVVTAASNKMMEDVAAQVE